MKNYNSKLKIIIVFSIIFFGVLFFAKSSLAANHYVRQGATGSGSDWSNAYGSLPATLTRGDTYYIADGNYASYIFDDAVSGTTVITIKKAMSTGYGTGDHGTETGWSSSYGDGQAVFAENITFYKGYYVIDGNGTHTIPSKNSSDYGFKIVNTQDANYGVITFGEWQETASNIIIKYVHAYNTYGSKIKDR